MYIVWNDRNELHEIVEVDANDYRMKCIDIGTETDFTLTDIDGHCFSRLTVNESREEFDADKNEYFTRKQWTDFTFTAFTMYQVDLIAQESTHVVGDYHFHKMCYTPVPQPKRGGGGGVRDDNDECTFTFYRVTCIKNELQTIQNKIGTDPYSFVKAYLD
jgi:hypothetical protein